MKFRKALAEVRLLRRTSVGTSADSAGPMKGPMADNASTNTNTSVSPWAEVRK